MVANMIEEEEGPGHKLKTKPRAGGKLRTQNR